MTTQKRYSQLRKVKSCTNLLALAKGFSNPKTAYLSFGKNDRSISASSLFDVQTDVVSLIMTQAGKMFSATGKILTKPRYLDEIHEICP